MKLLKALTLIALLALIILAFIGGIKDVFGEEQLYLDPKCQIPFNNEPVPPVLILYTKPKVEEINWDKLVECVIQAESGGDHLAIGKAGEIGLIQISPIVVEEYNNYFTDYYGKEHGLTGNAVWKCTTKDLYDSYTNKAIGTWYLKRLHTHYGCKSIAQILVAYNWGITRLRNVDYQSHRVPYEVLQYAEKIYKCYSGK